MRDILTLLLPGLIPSWAFFKAVEPSPRVQWRLIPPSNIAQGQWQEVRPRPQRVSVGQMVLRLFWNPQWNKALYLVSLAERLADEPTAHSLDEIHRLLAADLDATGGGAERVHLQFRLVFTHRKDTELVHAVTYVSAPRPLLERGP